MSDNLSRYTLKNGLVGYWRFDCPLANYTNAVDEVKDSSLTGAHGQTAGAPLITAGKIGGAYFNGVSGDDINLGNHAELRINGNLSIACWAICTSAVGIDRLLFHNTGNNDNKNYMTHVNLGVFEYVHGNTSTSEILSSTVNIADSVWHHLVVVSKHPALYFYIDGVLVKTETTTFDNVAISADKKVSHTASSVAWPGTIDELAVWDRAITADEITAIYNGGLARELGYKPIVMDMVDTVIVHENIVEEL